MSKTFFQKGRKILQGVFAHPASLYLPACLYVSILSHIHPSLLFVFSHSYVWIQRFFALKTSRFSCHEHQCGKSGRQRQHCWKTCVSSIGSHDQGKNATGTKLSHYCLNESAAGFVWTNVHFYHI